MRRIAAGGDGRERHSGAAHLVEGEAIQRRADAAALMIRVHGDEAQLPHPRQRIDVDHHEPDDHAALLGDPQGARLISGGLEEFLVLRCLPVGVDQGVQLTTEEFGDRLVDTGESSDIDRLDRGDVAVFGRMDHDRFHPAMFAPERLPT